MDKEFYALSICAVNRHPYVHKMYAKMVKFIQNILRWSLIPFWMFSLIPWCRSIYVLELKHWDDVLSGMPYAICSYALTLVFWAIVLLHFCSEKIFIYIIYIQSKLYKHAMYEIHKRIYKIKFQMSFFNKKWISYYLS